MINPFDPQLWGGVQFDHDEPILPPWDFLDILTIKDHDASSILKKPHGCYACGTFRTQPDESIPTGPFLLPAEPYEPLAMEVHTLCWGSAAWISTCLPTLEAWCVRHGHSLKVWKREDVPAHYPNEKFILVDLLRSFLEGDSERILWVDADVYVHPLAGEFPAHAEGLHMRIDQPTKVERKWPDWVREKFGRTVNGLHRYLNAGVWACDRKAAALLLRQIEKGPMVKGVMEQHQFNLWIHDAVEEDGMVVHHLPVKWNAMELREPAWFFHLAGKNKDDKILRTRSGGWIPDAVTTLRHFRPTVDYGKGAIVWPWDSSKSDWDELWFSWQSVRKHWKEDGWTCVLLADRKPAWWEGEFIYAPYYEDALWLGTQCAEKVLWMNDDIFMLADQTLEDYREARHLGSMEEKLGKHLIARGSWRRGLGQVLFRLLHHGRSIINFSTHTPYLYERKKVKEIFDTFGIFYKIPFETAYYNWHALPNKGCTEKSGGPHDMGEGRLWMNPAFVQVTPAFRELMATRYGDPAADQCNAMSE